MARTNDVVDVIKGMILDGRLKPGDRLPIEPELAAQLSISRGSLREGVRALIAMGVLEARQGAGTFVTDLGLQRLFEPLEFIAELHQHSALEFLQVRRAIEAETASQAASRITDYDLGIAQKLVDESRAMIEGPEPLDHSHLLDLDGEFHRIIARASGNAVSVALLDALNGRTRQLRLLRGHTNQTAVKASPFEHQAILDALRCRDSVRARMAMEVHLFGVEDYVREHDG